MTPLVRLSVARPVTPPETPDLTRTPPALADAWEEEHRDRDADTPSLLSLWLLGFAALMLPIYAWLILKAAQNAAATWAQVKAVLEAM